MNIIGLTPEERMDIGSISVFLGFVNREVAAISNLITGLPSPLRSRLLILDRELDRVREFIDGFSEAQLLASTFTPTPNTKRNRPAERGAVDRARLGLPCLRS